MSRWLSILLLAALIIPAGADVNDLANGTLIVHYVPTLSYCSDPPAAGWCGEYENHAISSFEEQITRLDVANYLPACWYVIAAWHEEKSWCGTEFGLGDYNSSIFGFVEHSACYPEGGLEIPTDNWPGPGEGIAFVVSGAAWSGNFVPVYWFGGYAYAYYGSGQIAVTTDPATGFAGTSNCLSPPVAFEATCMGALGINTDGLGCEDPGATGACCDPSTGDCQLLLEDECLALDFEFHPEWTSCDPNPCPPVAPQAVCCLNGLCYLLTEEECGLIQGEFFPALTSCDPNPCEVPVAACCVASVCVLASLDDCADYGGDWHPEWTSCDPNPCPVIPIETMSWGRIKELFR